MARASLTYIFSILSLSAAAKTLVLGDSHSFGQFGQSIAKVFSKADQDIWVYAVEGVGLEAWMTGGKYRLSANQKQFRKKLWNSFYGKVATLSEILDQAKSEGNAINEVIIQAGTNMYYMLNSENSKKELFDLLNSTNIFFRDRGLTCIWVTPPKSRVDWLTLAREQEFVDLIKKEMSSCRVFNSLPLLDPAKLSADDGTHYNPPEAEMWVAELMKFYKVALDGELKANVVIKKAQLAEPLILKANRVCSLELKLISKPKVKEVKGGFVYSNALAEYVYKVLKEDNVASCPKKGDSIILLHLILKNKKFTNQMNLMVGNSYSFDLIDFDAGFPQWKSTQTISDNDLFDVPRFAPVDEFEN